MSDLPAWAQSDERHPEREAEWRRLTADLEARGMVAALRNALAPFEYPVRSDTYYERLWPALLAALTSTASAAREHDEAVRRDERAKVERVVVGFLSPELPPTARAHHFPSPPVMDAIVAYGKRERAAGYLAGQEAMRERAVEVCDVRAEEFAVSATKGTGEWFLKEAACEQACTGNAHRIRALAPQPEAPGKAPACSCDTINTAFDGNQHGHNVSCAAWGTDVPNRAYCEGVPDGFNAVHTFRNGQCTTCGAAAPTPAVPAAEVQSVEAPHIDRDLARRLVRAGRHHLAWESSDSFVDEVIATVLRGAQ